MKLILKTDGLLITKRELRKYGKGSLIPLVYPFRSTTVSHGLAKR